MLPVIIGLLSPNPVIGVIALVWAILYQQVENLLIEPRISAKAVEVNPAVSFGAVLLGAALFGVAGAFLAVPVIAMLLALLNIYGHRYDLLPEIAERIDAKTVRPDPPVAHRHRTVERIPSWLTGGHEALVHEAEMSGGRGHVADPSTGYRDDDGSVNQEGQP